MGQRLLNVRVRPQRAVVLIDRNASEPALHLAFEFCSKVWGGRFWQIIPVDPRASDPLTGFRLAQSRPEFVYGIGLDDDHWRQAAVQSCQPRGYGELTPEFVRDIKRHHFEDYYLVDHALLHMLRARDQVKGHKRTLRLVSSESASVASACCAAMFGIHHPNLGTDYYDEMTSCDGTTTAFLDIAIEFVKECQQSWLDITGYELNPHIISSGWGELSPTIVLVENLVADLSLFWNLRTASDTSHPAWIVPIPAGDAADATVIEKVKQFLMEFRPYGAKPNFCEVTSHSVEEAQCRAFAQRLQTALTGTTFEFVDFERPGNRLPVVVPFEYGTTWPVQISGRKLTVVPPKPRTFEAMGSSRAWIVDLLKDSQTGRAVKELQVPASPVVLELLNGPCPPRYELVRLPRVGDGTESINVRCSDAKEVVKLYLPTEEEILGEILREYGIEPLTDEKRSSYGPVIKRFGGISLAAAALSGQSASILSVLIKDTLTLEQIKSKCRLGNQDVAGDSYLERIESMLHGQSERMKRVARHRFLEHSKGSLPENLKLRSLLDHWTDRNIVMRQWKIGPCSRCNQQYFVAGLNIQRPIICRNCGHRIRLPASVTTGYTLQRAVAHAMDEGLGPVVQTGRFLKNLTSDGFLWLPGVKYKIGDQPGDVDVLACCDGYLIFCECKSLDETAADSPVWNDVVSQFVETARVAALCKAHLAVLACRAGAYPQAVHDRIVQEVGNSIPYLLLNKDDLEKGYRPVQEGTHTRHLAFYDLLPIAFPETPSEPKDKPRTINMGWGTYTKG